MLSPRYYLVASLLLIHFLGFSQSKYKLLVDSARFYTQSGKYQDAINLLFKAKALKGIDKNYSERINMHLGNNYESLSKIDSSVFYYGEAIKFCESKKDYPALSFLSSRLGNIELSFTKRYPTAISYFKKQLYYDKILKDSTYLFDNLNNIGLSFKSLNKLDSALFYFNKVTQDPSKFNNSKNTALLFTADIYSLKKNYNSALANYKQAIKGLALAKDSIGLYAAYANIGDCLMQQNKFDESIQNLTKAEKYLSPYITDANKAVLYHNFAYVYGKQQQFDKAYYFKNLENITKDKINTKSIGNAIAEMGAKYELRQKQDSLFINKQKLVLANVKTSQKERNFLILLIASIAIIIFIFSIYRIRQLRYKNTLQQKQAEQNALNLMHQYQLSESELKSIRSQMNPHFIFNVLNSIESYIMENDKRTASRLIQKFAALSRLILENSTKSLVTADKEWKALMLYTELEAMRYAGAFTYAFEVDENIQLKRTYLPPMLIQPLIENAILHGLIQGDKKDGHLSVNIKKIENGICIMVADNGVGLNYKEKPSRFADIKEQSLGLASIKERIKMINKQYNDCASFTLRSGADLTGATAVVCLPVFKEQKLRGRFSLDG
ncbi:hypothetical protein ASE92_10515 [Pedobacter sp. Leaf41]|uniref:tetratricopeptide repeat-containing sensor histidine kinase n=1 Tax=Pedobacter sp. Leaf41 TaxID=1736218 RepID=UPI000702E1AD|nr:histidine kinase [Pedobacter sp. Leaf41]KQN35049.1 hypothetical protein ASE92_10515 [Pedobacter sp. Leaf41]